MIKDYDYFLDRFLTKLYLQEKEQVKQMSARERYAYFLLSYWNNPYLWGQENAEGADCSGAVSFAIIGATGFKIRTTANGLYKNIFTNRPNGIDAVFWKTKIERKYPQKTYPAGAIEHIAGIVDKNVILNMTWPKARLEPLPAAIIKAERDQYEIDIRGLNMNACEKYSGKMFYGVDKKLKELFI